MPLIVLQARVVAEVFRNTVVGLALLYVAILSLGCSQVPPRQAATKVTERSPHRSQDDAALAGRDHEVCAVALKYFLADRWSQTCEIVFLSIDGDDPPQQFLSETIRPGSHAEVFRPEIAGQAVRDKHTGELGSEVNLKILRWTGPEHVVVRCSSFYGWVVGCNI